MTKKTDKENKEVVVTFRLSQSEFSPYEKLIEESGLKKSRLMREIFIAKVGKVALPKTQSKESKRLLFLANKASNNINQLAHKLNMDYNKGIVTENTYNLLLNNLINIERSLFSGIDKC